MSKSNYLHGFSKTEQQRLQRQARFADQMIYRDVDFSHHKKILEIGAGVGAQSEILLRRFPDIHLTAIDFSETQLEVARKHLEDSVHAKTRFDLQKMDAQQLQFESNSFDGAFICWTLEHIEDPKRVLSEARRVVRPGGRIYVTEAMNSSFLIDPYSPNIWRYWTAFNDFQWHSGGDPFVGAKLGNFLTALNFHDIKTSIKTWHLDNREPTKRQEKILFWKDLMLSAAPQLLEAGCVDQALVDAMASDFERVASDPNAVFYYAFVQASARVMD